MSEDIGASGASVLVSGHMSNRMSSRIAVVGGRRRWAPVHYWDTDSR